MRSKQIFWTLQAGRGIAAALVVFHHCSSYFGTDPRFWRQMWYARLFRFGALGVNFFFVLSGIVIFLAHRRDLGVPGALPRFLAKRFKRIYPIYWVVLAFVGSIFLISPRLMQPDQRSIWVVLSSILLVHLGSTAAIVGVAWSLFAEILFYGFFALLIVNRRLGTVAFGLWFLASIAQAIHPTSAHPVLYAYTTPWHLLFGLGVLVAFWINDASVKQPSIRLTLTLGAVMMGVACVWCDLRGPKVPVVYLFGGLASAVFLFGMMSAEREGMISVGPSLRLLGDASYSIYLIHFTLLSFFSRPVFKVAMRLPWVPTPIWFVLESLAAIAVGIALHWYIEKPLLRWQPGAVRQETLPPEMRAINSLEDSTQNR